MVSSLEGRLFRRRFVSGLRHLLNRWNILWRLKLGTFVAICIRLKVLVIVLTLASHLVAVELIIVVILIVVPSCHHHWSRRLFDQQLSKVSANLFSTPDFLCLDLIEPFENVPDIRFWLGVLQVNIHCQTVGLGQDISRIVLHIRMEVFCEFEGCHANVLCDQSTSDQPESRRHGSEVGLS